MSAGDIAVCVACRLTFSARNAGFLGCRAHPQTLDFDTGHFRCCGAAPSGSSCAAHAECTRVEAAGCHPVDHCATTEERERILRDRPYVVGPLDQALTQMPYAARHDGESVFHITREDQLNDAKFSAPVSPMWKGAGVSPDGRLPIDLRAEHATLRNALIEREYAMACAPIEAIDAANDLSDPYASEWVRHAAGVDDIATPLFVPFVIVMRIGTRPVYPRGAGRTPCVWKD